MTITDLFPFVSKNPITVAINYKAVSGPWGGASVFIRQLKASLQRCNISVRFDLKRKVNVIFMIDPREDLQKTAFGLSEIKAYKNKHPEVRVIHRINECDGRKGTEFMDGMLEEGNRVADYTIFISQWLKEYFSKRWFNPDCPHTVIYNGADERYFHPVGGQVWDGISPLRLVTHHWSDNPMKGFPVYQQLDSLIAEGVLPSVELWVIGRWPQNIQWKSARTFPPSVDRQLGELLRECHAYITASLWEPCGMHHVEGAQCGLPLLCHEDGGGIVEAAKRYGVLFRDDLIGGIDNIKDNYSTLRKRVLTQMPSGGLMSVEYVRAIQFVLADI